ncbi:hypothetical protein BT63DRAFT_428288 [Microthyrium microscopicum]|uniref:FHA domain-containing protein n=1 Tax=Microthyrium microscopicum TaxID=703497 RepID=A0A6A6U0Z2_9PEZI|nr:hypothetical protein BT63DRAFT_428288 [Microthyrium microscopicum]
MPPPLPPSTARLMLKLTLVDGDDNLNSRSIELTEGDSVIVGRASKDPNKNIQARTHNFNITNSVVSRHHAHFYYQRSSTMPSLPCKLYIEDGGSSHGTYLNEERIPQGSKKEVNDGDEIRFGVKVVRADAEFPPPVYSVELEEVEDDDDAGLNANGRSYGFHDLVQADIDEMIAGASHDDHDDGYSDGYSDAEAGEDYPGSEELWDQDDYDHDHLEDDIEELYDEEQQFELDTTLGPKDTNDNPIHARQASFNGQPLSTAYKFDVFQATNLNAVEVPGLLQNDESSSDPSSSLPVSPEQTRAGTDFWTVALQPPPGMAQATAGASEPTKVHPDRQRMLAVEELVNSTEPSSTSFVGRKRKANAMDALEQPVTQRSPVVIVDVQPQVNATESSTSQLEIAMSSSTLARPEQVKQQVEHVQERMKQVKEKLAQALKEPVDVQAAMATQDAPVEPPRKRARMTNVAIGVGAFVAGSVSTIAALASLPESFFL